MLKHLEISAAPLKCIKLITLVEKCLASKANNTAFTCNATFGSFRDFINHIEPAHNLRWYSNNIRTIRDYFVLGTTVEERKAYFDKIALFLLYKTNGINSLKKKFTQL